jgi:high-affinity iron transporter
MKSDIAFWLALREGLEAALIIGIVLGALRKLGYAQHGRYVWLGATGAMVVSLAVAVALAAWGAQLEGTAATVFEGVTMLLAALILTWMIAWMMVRGRHLQASLEGRVRQTVATAHQWGLFWLAFVTVVREGLELALFLTASVFATSAYEALIGALLGIAAAVALGWATLTMTVRLNLGGFFRVTSVIMVLVAAGLVAHGVHELNEVGVVPVGVAHVWDINSILPDQSAVGQLLKTLVGYNGDPSMTEVLSYVFYLVVALFVLWQAKSAKLVKSR